MISRRILYVCNCAALTVVLGTRFAWAEPSTEVRQQAAQTQAMLAQASEQLAARRFPEAIAQYKLARTSAEQFVKQADASDPATVLLVGPIRRRLGELHGRLELEGFELEPLGPSIKPPTEAPPPKPPARKIEMPVDPKPAGKSPPPAMPAALPSGAPAFSTHVAPVLAAKCITCHGGRQPRNRLSVESFAQLLRGGMSGRVVAAGNGAGSLLVQKLKGTAKEGQRMPLDADPLSAAEIAAIEQWIATGAKFDGSDPARPLAEVIALGAARGATHEELSRQRAATADKNWKLAIPDDAARTTTTDNFLVIGNVPQQRLESVAAEAERLVAPIRTALGLPTDKPLVRGRLTIYAMAHRYDYTEFALMVERRSRLPRTQVGHWQFTVADAYALVVVPDDSQKGEPAYGLAPLLAEQIAGATVAARW